MASRSKKSGQGLQILWIPGRRKHNHKGKYDVTNKGQQHEHHQKKNEPWSLGGSKGHEEIIKSDIDTPIDGTTAHHLSSAIIPSSAACATDIITSENCNDDDVRHEKSNVTTIPEIHDTPTNKIDPKDPSQYNNSNTLPMVGTSKRSSPTGSTKTDYDSIERLNDTLDGKDTVNNGLDERKLVRVPDQRRHHRVKDDRMMKFATDKKEKKEDDAVTCLYYTLMCCECSIS